MLSDVHKAVMKTYFELYLSGCMTLTELVREVGNVFVDEEGEPVHIQYISEGRMAIVWAEGGDYVEHYIGVDSDGDV
jgi:hypothetical protein